MRGHSFRSIITSKNDKQVPLQKSPFKNKPHYAQQFSTVNFNYRKNRPPDPSMSQNMNTSPLWEHEMISGIRNRYGNVLLRH